MLELRNVKKRYGQTVVLEVPSLALDKGIYWVKGANGSGKTTLLKMIAGLLPFDGDIFFNGISIKDKAYHYRQQVSWAEAEPLFPSFLSGRDLVQLYKEIRKVEQDEVSKLLALFEIMPYIDNRVGTYSAGMLKKLSLVLSFIGNAPLVILDEPLITLDPKALTTVSDYILEKNAAFGTTFILSSHQEVESNLLKATTQLAVANQSITIA